MKELLTTAKVKAMVGVLIIFLITCSAVAENILLGRPTDDSVTANVIPEQSGEISFEYGTTSGVYGNQTSAVPCTINVPVKAVISGLSSNTKYYYRMRFRATGGDPWTPGNEHTFLTQRAIGSTFTFTITSDSHVNILMGSAATWAQTLNRVANNHPDFHLDLGDTVAMRSVSAGDVAGAEAAYKFQRTTTGGNGTFNLISNSAPIFLAAGNHEQQEGWHLLSPPATPNSLPVIGTNAMKKYFLNPVPDAFYSGDVNTYSYLTGDQLRENYYAWTWGDALFVVIDPYWFSTTKPYVSDPGGGETDATGSGDSWDWTLGQEQFNWFKQTIEGSNAKFKFVFSHQMTADGSLSGQEDYGHGGANHAHFVEWGGYNEDGTTWGWDTERPGWGSQPIHQMMVANGVSAFFHGHDHQYAYEKRDGIVYQAVPSGSFTGTFGMYATGSGNTIWADSTQVPGYLHVTVSPTQATVAYVRTSGGTVAYSYGIVDIIPPTPNPMTWATVPTATGSTSITMTATTATDANSPPVQYYFECTTDGSKSSSWQTSPTYIANGLNPSTLYTFRVKARDNATPQNETGWSSPQSATTLPPGVSIIGSWVTGTTHAKETGNNRALILIAHSEHSADVNLTTVLYGGQRMKKITDIRVGSGTSNRVYVAAYRLSEPNIALATSPPGTFTPTWSVTPTSVSYTSVFLSNVNQTTLIGATARNFATTGTTLATSALANSAGDMVIEGATSSVTGTYTANNSFTKDIDLGVTGFDGMDGHKPATGVAETPSITHPTGNQVLIGFVVKVASSVSPPGQATSPSPADGAINVGVTTDLSWTAGTGSPTSRDVYFGTAASPPLVSSSQVPTTYDTGTMSNNTTYYWRIDEKNAGGTTTGVLWSFTTIPAQYTLTINTVGSGTVTKNPDQATYAPGTVVTLTANPSTGWSFSAWSVDLSGSTNPTTITMNSNKNVTATFTQNEYTLAVTTVGSGTVTKVPNQATYHYGDVVQLTANPAVGWSFSAWSVDLSGSTNPQNITINGNKTVTATFTQNVYTLTINKVGNGTVTPDIAPPYHYGDVVTLSATADTGWTFTGFDPGAVITMDSDKTVTATFTQNVYTLTINKVGNGTVTPDIAAPYHYGDVVTLSATADTGWTFAGFDPSAVVTMDDNKTVTATFTQNVYTLTINKVGNGTVTPDIAAPYHYGDVVTLSAEADTGWTFAGFDPGAVITMDSDKTVTATFTQNVYTLTINKVGNGTVTPDIAAPYHYGDVVTLSATADTGWTFTGFDPGAVITMDSDKTVTATFTQNVYTLTINKVGNGTVTPDIAAPYHYGDVVTLSATADTGWTFAGFDPGAVVTMDSDKTVTATFTQNVYTLTINKVGNGTVTPDIAAPYHYGDVVTLSATADTGWTFAGFDPGAVVTMDSDKTVTATFTQNVYTLTINKVGNGTVTPDIAAPYHYGDVVTLSATADTGWTFAGFDPGAVVTMDDNKTVTATFTQNVYTLTINKVGNGTVTPDIAAPYHYGDVVTLGATADTGWTFAGFDPSAVVTMDDNKTVTATFTQNVYTLTINKVGNGTVTPDIAPPYHYGDVVTLSATADTGWTFAGFDPGAVITMDSDKTVTATFTQNVYTLTINKVGNGTVTPDIAPPYHYGDVVTLSATADTGWTFAGFDPGAVITMDSDKTVTATFTQNVYTLTINKVGNGTVTPDIAPPYHYGDVVTLSATADTGWYFSEWSGDASGSENPKTIIMNGNKTITANYAVIQMTISGYVTEPDANIPVVGVSIDANNGGGSDTTDTDGYYELTVAYGWSGMVTLSKTGYTFEPNGTEYSNVTTDQGDNYTAILDTFIISGYAVDSELTPLDGVLVSPDNDGGPYTSKYYGGGHDTTGANGYYEVVVDYNWSGKVVPSKYAYAFQPSSITYTNITEDKVEIQNYVGTLLTYTITGYIKNSRGVPIKGVLVDASLGGDSDITDANGYYEVWVNYNWSGTITPSKAHYTFEPSSKAYTNVLENKTAQNYEATNIYDLDCDGLISWGDVAVMTDNWLDDTVGNICDFNADAIVNFRDYTEFANVWLTEQGE